MGRTVTNRAFLAVALASVALAVPVPGQVPTPAGSSLAGCASAPISLVVSNDPTFGLILGPSPAGFPSFSGVFLIYDTPPPIPVPLIVYPLAGTTTFGSSGGCCLPGPALIYSFVSFVVSPFEFSTIGPYPQYLWGSQVWVQELLIRPPSPFAPCTIYVTDDVLFTL